MFQISKTFSFDAAHRLVNGYTGKCANIHGHTWQVKVTVTAATLNHFGFVKDFSDLKPIKDWVDQHLDHAMIASITDQKVVDFVTKQGMKLYVMNDNPTSENLCELLYRVCHEEIKLPVKVIEIHETCTCSASYPVSL